jgi:hypothetical protein
MEAVPPLAMLVAGTTAVNCVEETKVVASGDPFQFTVEVETKFVPLTVKVNCTSPADAHIGLSELMVGTDRALMVNVTTLLIVPHWPLEYVAKSVTVYVPAVVGVPEMVLPDKLKPGGKGPPPQLEQDVR